MARFAFWFPSFILTVGMSFLLWVFFSAPLGAQWVPTVSGACVYVLIVFLPVAWVCDDLTRRLGASPRA